MTLKQLQPSTVEYLGPWDIAAADDDLDPLDPSSTVAEIALTGTGETVDDQTTWHPAEWVTDTDPTPTVYRLRTSDTFGATDSTADVELAAGVYRVWARITSAPERPVLWLDTIWIR